MDWGIARVRASVRVYMCLLDYSSASLPNVATMNKSSASHF